MCPPRGARCPMHWPIAALANCALVTARPQTVSELSEPVKGDSPIYTYHSFSQGKFTERLPHIYPQLAHGRRKVGSWETYRIVQKRYRIVQKADLGPYFIGTLGPNFSSCVRDTAEMKPLRCLFHLHVWHTSHNDEGQRYQLCTRGGAYRENTHWPTTGLARTRSHLEHLFDTLGHVYQGPVALQRAPRHHHPVRRERRNLDEKSPSLRDVIALKRAGLAGVGDKAAGAGSQSGPLAGH